MKPPTLRGTARAYLMSIAFWCGFALLMGLQYRPLSREHLWSSLASLLVDAALRGLALAFWTPPIFYLVRRHLSVSTSRFGYVLLWSLGAVPFLLLQTSILWVLAPAYDDQQRYVPRSFHSWLDMIRNGFADQVFIYVAIVVAAHAYEYLKRLRRQERERYEYQQALAASELQALKMELHPHFLFNTLHGIATLVDDDPRCAKDMIIKLSNLLRTGLDRDSSDLVPLQDELKFAREYLDLEKMRFGSRLKIEWLVAPEICRLLVPRMILQPLVENAIRHGVASTREGGWIKIAASADNEILTIQLRNSVGGNASNGTGLGLRNVEARLKCLYAGDATVRLSVGEDRIATVSLTMPALDSQPGSVREPQVQAILEGEGRYARSHRG
jgi:two-component system LytT family sensor kinase